MYSDVYIQSSRLAYLTFSQNYKVCTLYNIEAIECSVPKDAGFDIRTCVGAREHVRGVGRRESLIISSHFVGLESGLL